MRNVIITGGELFNKGAQAMVYITVDELKKRYPDHEIYVLSEMDLRRPECERSKYTFHFTGWYPIKFARAQANWLLRQVCKLRNYKDYSEMYELYSKCDLMIDISGYSLGSIWSYNNYNTYLDHIEYAVRFHIPFYIMPQSFGPFDFAGDKAAETQERIRNLLPTVKIICAREKENYKLLKELFQLNNVILKPDIVLNNKRINPSNIFINPTQTSCIEIEENSVGIVPNGETLEYLDKEYVLDLYEGIIAVLLEKDYFIYLICHAESDIYLCRAIKDRFSTIDSVVLFDIDLDCFEYSNISKHFKMIIASRFHSIVHAYKQGVPCVSIGWAQKYKELLENFNQSRYAFDVRDGICLDGLQKEIMHLLNNLETEKKMILSCLIDYQKDNVFDILPKKI